MWLCVCVLLVVGLFCVFCRSFGWIVVWCGVGVFVGGCLVFFCFLC